MHVMWGELHVSTPRPKPERSRKLGRAKLDVFWRDVQAPWSLRWPHTTGRRRSFPPWPERVCCQKRVPAVRKRGRAALIHGTPIGLDRSAARSLRCWCECLTPPHPGHAYLRAQQSPRSAWVRSMAQRLRWPTVPVWPDRRGYAAHSCPRRSCLPVIPSAHQCDCRCPMVARE